MATHLEELAIKVHDCVWINCGDNLEISGEDATIDEITGLLNQLQREIKDRGLATHNYSQTNGRCG
jgi:hypothetical protein